MSEANLFDTARVRVGGKCVAVDMRESEPQQPCGYFLGKPAGGGLCRRCGLPWLPHWPELNRPRRARPVRQICDVCSFEIESEQHSNHCGG
jgi:hypothetical protein